MPFKNRRIICLLFFVGLYQFVFSQSFNPDALIKTNYTIEDGLPSNECHAVIQDSLGYIWIATDRGLVKYDGYDFEVYGTEKGLMDISCLDLRFGLSGNLWILTYSNQIFIYDPINDQLRLFEYQQIIDKYLSVTKILDFAVSSTGTFVAALSGLGFLSIESNGNHMLDMKAPVDSVASFFSKNIEGEMLISGTTRGPAPQFLELRDLKKITIKKGYDQHLKQLYLEDLVIKGIDDLNMPNSNLEAFKLKDSSMVLNIHGVNYFFHDGIINIEKHQSEFEDIKNLGSNSFVSAELNKKGVKYYSTWEDLTKNHFISLLENISASQILIDKQQNIWVSTTDRGVFKLYQSDFGIVSDSKGLKVRDIEAGKDRLFYLIDKKELRSTNALDSFESVLIDESNRIHSITFDSFHNELIVNKNYSVTLKQNRVYKNIEYEYGNHHKIRAASSFQESFVFDHNDILAVHPDNFFLYQDLDSLNKYHSYLLEPIIKVRAAARIGDGDYLIGTLEGLKRFRSEVFLDDFAYPTELQIRINGIKPMNDVFLFGTQGNGLVLWDLNEKLRTVNTSDGLLSNTIESIFIDSRDRIYLSTMAGLSILQIDSPDSFDIKNYTTSHGLPSNELNDVVEWNDNIYIATGRGLVTLKEEVTSPLTQNVLIERISAMDSIYQYSNQSISIPYEKNDLKISFKTLDYSLGSKILYRYRLNGGDWTITKSTIADFSSIRENEYRFEVQSKNANGQWSKSTSVNFEILPPWWRTWWFYSGSMLLFLATLYATYLNRTFRLREKLQTERELKELERSALQAQMNPHFIFNCLNSIQNFIMNNEKEEAMEYLTSFAQLIRGNLNASIQNEISLFDEEQMLRNYLYLEQLRLNHKFNFQITFDSNIEKEEIHIPPMLIQPFVENAVIHGMKHIKKDGEIELHFSIENKSLIILVKDNGRVVFNTSDNTKHKSLGISITQKRLQHIRKNQIVDISPEFTEEGTRVRLTIPIAD